MLIDKAVFDSNNNMQDIHLWMNRSSSVATAILNEVSEIIALTPPIPIKQVVELYVPSTTIVGITNPEFNSSISACATRDMKKGWYILINQSEPIKRQRFSLAHELAHMTVITNTASTVYCGKFDDWEEKVCDSFAGKILVPDKMLLEYCQSNPNPHVLSVSEVFQVSTPVVEIRMKELGLPFRYTNPF